MAAQDYEQCTYNSPDGAMIGQSATEKIAFHGSTPVDQYAAIADQSILALISGSVVGFTTSASFSSTVEKVNLILAALREKGLIAT
jgi:hypothetical protein